MKDIPGTKYITRNNGGYDLAIYENRKKKYLGHSNSLISILMMRDWCGTNNWEVFPRQLNKTTGIKNIVKDKRGYYIIYKKINGKTNYFARTFSLDDAIVLKDYFEKNNWNKPINKLKYIHEITVNGSKRYYIARYNPYTYFGYFKNLDDAIKERDLLIKSGWDFDILCECIDERVDNKIIWNGSEIYEKRRL